MLRQIETGQIQISLRIGKTGQTAWTMQFDRFPYSHLSSMNHGESKKETSANLGPVVQK